MHRALSAETGTPWLRSSGSPGFAASSDVTARVGNRAGMAAPVGVWLRQVTSSARPRQPGRTPLGERGDPAMD